MPDEDIVYSSTKCGSREIGARGSARLCVMNIKMGGVIMKRCGIYRFYNTVNGKSYIGRSNNLRHRYTEHISLLRRGADPCPLLMKAWNKYGEEKFAYEVLCYCDESELNDCEQYYISKYDSLRNGYNCTSGGDGILGFHHSDDAKRRIGDASRGKKLSAEHCRLMSESQKGKSLTEQHKAALSAAWTPERKVSFIESRTGKKNPNYGKTGVKACYRVAVVCGTGEFFHTIRDAATWCGQKSTGNISSCCSNVRQYAGTHPNSGERLTWRYATEQEIQNHNAVA